MEVARTSKNSYHISWLLLSLIELTNGISDLAKVGVLTEQFSEKCQSLLDNATALENQLRKELRDFHAWLNSNILVASNDPETPPNSKKVSSISDLTSSELEHQVSISYTSELDQFLSSIKSSLDLLFAACSSTLLSFDSTQGTSDQHNRIVFTNIVTMIIRCTRNCATHRAFQTSAGLLEIVPTTVTLASSSTMWLRWCKVTGYLSKDMTDSVSSLNRSCIQFFSNLVTAHSANQRRVWNSVFPQFIQLCLELNALDHLLVANIAMFLNNSIARNDPLKADLLANAVILRTLFARLVEHSHSTEKNYDEASRWVLVLSKRLWTDFEKFVCILGDPAGALNFTENRLTPPATEEQLFCLHILDTHIGEWIEDSPEATLRDIFGGRASEALTFLLYWILRMDTLSLLVAYMDTGHDSMIELCSDENCPSPEEPQKSSLEQLHEMAEQTRRFSIPSLNASWLCFRIAASILSILPLAEKEELAMKENPFSLYVTLPAERDFFIRIIVSWLMQSFSLPSDVRLSSSTSKKEVSIEGFKGWKCAIVRVLANFVHRSKIVQDQIRTFHGIPLLLNCCKDDIVNPYMREWGLFACRNLCEGNLENQQLIAAMKSSGAIPSVELERLGFKAMMEPGGKIRLERIEDVHDRPNQP